MSTKKHLATFVSCFIVSVLIAAIFDSPKFGATMIAVSAYFDLGPIWNRYKVGEFMSMPFPQMWARIRGKPSSYDR